MLTSPAATMKSGSPSVASMEYDGDQRVLDRRQEATSPLFTIRKGVVTFVVVPLLIHTFRNSIALFLNQYFGVWGKFWQHLYHRIALACNNDPFNIFVWGTTVVEYVVYWGVGCLYSLSDLTGRPDFLRRYKVQPGTNDPLSFWDFLKCVAVVHFNQLLSVPVLCGIYHLMVARGADFSQHIPDFSTIIVHLLVFILLNEILFYYSHRLLHHRLIYRHIHKLHHTWQSPVSITASYDHPVEHLLSNMVPITAGPLLMGSHPFTIWLWVVIAVVYTLAHHSGYHLPLMPSPQFHDYHHLKFNECYGVLGILDDLHGTDHKFRQSVNFRNHRTFYSLNPPFAAPSHKTKLQ